MCVYKKHMNKIIKSQTFFIRLIFACLIILTISSCGKKKVASVDDSPSDMIIETHLDSSEPINVAEPGSDADVSDATSAPQDTTVSPHDDVVSISPHGDVSSISPHDDVSPDTKASVLNDVTSTTKTTVPTPTSNQEKSLRLVDKILDSMSIANIVFNKPEILYLNKTAKIQLLLSLKKSIEELKHEVSPESEGQIEGAVVKVAALMKAQLTSINTFKINDITTAEQAIGINDTVEWLWAINPLLTGTHTLHLTLTAIFKVDGREVHRSIKTFDYKIVVDVTHWDEIKEFIKKYWQWLWASVFLPVGVWIWNHRTANSQMTNT